MQATTTSSTSPPERTRNHRSAWLLLNEQLGRLTALFPEAGHNGKTLRIVASEWAALLQQEEATTAEFLAAMTVLKRRCKFFPTPADLYEALAWVREHPPRIPENRRLEEPAPTPESQEKTRLGCAIIGEMLSRKITAAEARRRIDALVGVSP